MFDGVAFGIVNDGLSPLNQSRHVFTQLRGTAENLPRQEHEKADRYTSQENDRGHRWDAPYQAPVNREDNVTQENGQQEGPEQRRKLLEQIPGYGGNDEAS